MLSESVLRSFCDQFQSLKYIVSQSNARILDDENTDILFSDHQNVFIKSFLVSACSVLEAFIQDIAYLFVSEMQAKITQANLPHNFVGWEIQSKFPDIEDSKANRKFSSFSGKLNKKNLEERVSGNYYKTKILFRDLGVDVESDDEFCSFKETVSALIGKRNKIVHHNDQATDLSFQDVEAAIDTFEAYSRCMFRVLKNSPYRVSTISETAE